MFLTRRSFLAASGAALGGGALWQWLGPAAPAREPRAPVIDLHVHLFGVGDGGSGCFLSPRQQRHPNFRVLRRLLGVRDGRPMDEQYVDALLAMLRASSVHKAVLFAQDGRYDAAGRFDREATSVYVPNDWVLAVCARDPQRLIPCA